MRALIFQDLRVSLFYIALVLPWYLLFVTQAVFLPIGFIEGYLILVLATCVCPMLIEFINSSEITTLSLPVSRIEIVRARYLLSLLIAVAAVLLCGLHLSGVRHLLGRGEVLLDRFLSAPGVTIFLGVPILLLAYLLPLCLTLGCLRGAAIFLGTLLLGALLLRGLGFSPEILGHDSPFLVATDLLAGHLKKEGPRLLLSIWGGLLTILGLSYILAVRLYRRREF